MKRAEYKLDAALWELTLKCNLNCMHCGSVAGRGREKELTLTECFRVADELLELDCKELTFIGGEIFFYTGWEKIARYLSLNGVLVNIISNGYRVGEKEIDLIKYANLNNVGISIDGMEENHNRIRRKKDSFLYIKNTFDLLNRASIPIAAVTSLLDFNFFDLEGLYTFLLKNNVQLWQLQLVNPMGNMAGNKELIINPDKIPLVTEFVREKNKFSRMEILAADSIGYFDDNESFIRGKRKPIGYFEGCQAGISTVFIDSAGNVKGCGALYSDAFIEGNVRNQHLREIWNSADSFSYNRKFNTRLLTGKCRHCDAGDICRGGCRASNYFTVNSLYNNVFCCHDK